MNTLSRWLALAVFCFCPMVSASEPLLAEYERCYEAGDMACMERLHTPNAWRKQSAVYARVFRQTSERDLIWSGNVYATDKRWSNRTLYVVAVRGYANTPTQKRRVSAVMGFDVDPEGRIHGTRQITVDPNIYKRRKPTWDGYTWAADRMTPEAYADLWPKVSKARKHASYVNVADVLTTACVVAKYGAGVEANPITRTVFSKLGPVGGSVALVAAGEAVNGVFARDYWWGNGAPPAALMPLKWAVVGSNAIQCVAS